MSSLALQRSGPALVLTLRRADALNALDEELVDVLLAVLAEPPPDIGALVLTGEGDRAFCAGADLKRMATLEEAPLEAFLTATSRLFRALAELPLATIAAVNGHAHGAGAELACACDLRVGCERTSFRFPGVRYGLAVGTWHLAGLVGTGAAKDLLLTARAVDAEEALRLGLLQRLVPRARLLDEALAIAEEIASRPRDAVASIKALLGEGFAGTIVERMEREAIGTRDGRLRGRAQGLMARTLGLQPAEE
ncbi:MAG TPA: enoyl-CoA hydratase/isomerase family protein [Thermoanaerobaculia bacterium]|nr:enoyl-CoA hydratase/isomerase family protein [Thermoanaerobaculia bacterium]